MPNTTHLVRNPTCRCKPCRAEAMRVRRERYLARTDDQIERHRAALRPGGVKRCGPCRAVKDFSEFYPNKYTRDGLTDKCRHCVAESRGLVNRTSADVLAFWASNGMSPNECTYCGTALSFLEPIPGLPAMQADHIIARARGGGDEPENLAPACPQCNRVKRDRLLADFLTVPSKR